MAHHIRIDIKIINKKNLCPRVVGVLANIKVGVDFLYLAPRQNADVGSTSAGIQQRRKVRQTQMHKDRTRKLSEVTLNRYLKIQQKN